VPRIRSVHPDICDDEVLAEVSAYAERTFVRLWTHLDDEGRGKDNAKLWKGKLYPLHDDVTPDRVERDLAELEACGLILRYEVDGKRLLCCKASTWAKFQRPQHPTPSKIPGPHEVSADPHEDSRGLTREGSGVEGSRSSPRDPESAPETVWAALARKKLNGAQVNNPTAWCRKVAKNEQEELGDRADWLWATYEITEPQLVDVLANGGQSPLLNSLPKRKEINHG
jgi:hypothetical protein